MPHREKLIHFQNQAEADFEARKTPSTTARFAAALVLFMGSTLYAAFSWPFRAGAKALSSAPPPTGIIDLNKDNFEQTTQQHPLVLLDFWAEWCGPCVMMGPTLKAFAAANGQVLIGKVNADANGALTKQLNVWGLPTFVLLRNGREVARHAGPMTQTELERFCGLDEEV